MRWINGVLLSLFLVVPVGAWADVLPAPPRRENPTPQPPPPPPADTEPELTARPIPTDLGKRMDEAILLLSLKNYEGFVESFARPEVLAEMKAQGAMEEVLKDAAEHPDKVWALHLAIRRARLEPILMTADGSIAVVMTGEYQETIGEDAVVFQKVDGNWYLMAE